MTRLRASLLVVVFAATACPQPAQVTSIDGLTGGTIDGDVTAGAYEGASVSVDDLAAKTATIPTLGFGEATGTSLEVSGAVTAASANVTSLTAGSVTAETLTTTALTVDGVAFAPALLGVAPRTVTTPGAAGADENCVGAFDAGAHVCSETEFFTALRFFSGDRATFSGATVNTAHRQVGTAVDPDGDVAVVADNCSDWSFIPDPPDAAGIQLTQETDLFDIVDPDIRLRRTIHVRAALALDGDHISVATSARCFIGQVNFACCR